jgi:hypothetical protein
LIPIQLRAHESVAEGRQTAAGRKLLPFERSVRGVDLVGVAQRNGVLALLDGQLRHDLVRQLLRGPVLCTAALVVKAADKLKRLATAD